MKWFGILTAFLVVLLSLFLVLLIPQIAKDTGVCEDASAKTTARDKPVMNLASDREIYHSSEEMRLNAIAGPSENSENVTLRIYGIRDNSGNLRVSEERNATMGQDGLNETFVFRMPSCYGCAGVSPGEYEIVMEMWRNGELAGNCSKTVALEK